MAIPLKIATEAKPDPYLRRQAWLYFRMHAGQRLTTFNYYILISSVVTTGIFAASLKEHPIPGAPMLLGAFLFVLSGTFWKLDKRNRELIDNAEGALRFFESCTEPKDHAGEPHLAKVFSREERITTSKRANMSFFTLKRHFTYADCFNVIFLVFAMAGVFGMVFGGIQLLALLWTIHFWR